MRRFLFLLRTYPDLDHIAPMIWTCLERGDAAIAVFEEPYSFEEDFRIQFLRRYRTFRVTRLLGVTSELRWARRASRAIWNYHAVRGFLRYQRIDAAFFEWGPGIVSGRKRAPIRRRLLEGLRAGALRRRLIRAAKDEGLPIFALPHGIMTKVNIDYNAKMIAFMERHAGELPFEDRNCFTVWVFTAEFQRRLMVEYGRMDPQIGQTWGSLRFCPQWMNVLDRICPEETLPAKKEGQFRLTCFVPKWVNRVDKEATIQLFESIGARGDIQLILKTHPRKGTSELGEGDFERLSGLEHVILREEVHSHALIRASDIVIDVGSSIVIDAILQRKHVIYPAYLHENRLVFDQFGGCWIPTSQAEVHALLDRIVSGSLLPLAGADVEPVMREMVYGGLEPFDVPDHYYRQIQRYLGPVRI